MAIIEIHFEVPIKAPAEQVWKTLTDTSTWPQWNPYIPHAEIIDGKNQASSQAPGTWTLGSLRRFHVTMSGKSMKSTQKVVTHETPDATKPGPRKYRICWAEQDYFDFLLNTYRYNEIEEVSDSECIYTTGETQTGIFAYLVKLLFGKQIVKGIGDWADGLKLYMESERGQTERAPVLSA